VFLLFTHLAHYLYDATFLFLTVSGPLTIPLSLMGHSLLAVLTNGFISALNEIRECAPLKITAKAAASTTECLQSVAVALGDHHQRFSLSFDQVSVCGCGKSSFFRDVRTHSSWLRVDAASYASEAGLRLFTWMTTAAVFVWVIYSHPIAAHSLSVNRRHFAVCVFYLRAPLCHVWQRRLPPYSSRLARAWPWGGTKPVIPVGA